jgi:hypothetical protein
MAKNYINPNNNQPSYGQSYVSADYAPMQQATPGGDPTQDALDLIDHARRAGSNSVDDFLQRPDQLATQRPPQTVTMARLIRKNMNVPALRAAYSGNQP